MVIKVGVIGVGVMGEHHARVYAELPNVELVGIVDINKNTVREIANRYSTEAYIDYKKLLKCDLDAVSIVVPTSLHAKVAVDVANAGVDVLIEKPIANTIGNALKIIKSADKNDVKVMIGHIERFNPIIPIIQNNIRNCDVISIDVTRVGPFPPRVRDVGVVIDLAIHDIDLLRYLTKSEFNKIYGLMSKNISENEDAAILSFEMDNGVLAHITTNWLTPFKIREISIAMKEKFVKGSFIDQKVVEYSEYGDDTLYVEKDLSVPYSEPLSVELMSFLKAVSENKNPPISGEDGLKALEVAIKCMKA